VKEVELLGKLMPGHLDIFPMVETLREKYLLREVDPDGEAITKILIVTNPGARIAHSMKR